MTTPTTVFGRLSLRSRVALLAAAAVGLGIAIASIAAYITVSHQLYASRDANLVVRANAAVNSLLAVPRELVQIPAEALGAADVRLGLVVISPERIQYVSPGNQAAPPFGPFDRPPAGLDPPGTGAIFS